MEPFNFDLSGKNAIVTGAGRGIGRACALALAAHGANVAVTARSTGEIDEVCAEIKKAGRKSIAVTADVRSRDEAQKVVDETVASLGSVDILVNNAGVYVMRPLVHDSNWRSKFADFVPDFEKPFTEEDWDFMMDVNVKGIFNFCQAVGPHMMAQKSGRVINIGSIDAEHGFRFAAPYCGTKGAVKSFTKGLAREWIPYGITVNCVSPGYTRTPLVPWLYDDPEKSKSAAKAVVPMGRYAEPEEIAAPVIYLASQWGSYVTGQSIYVDGGYLA
ncbi:MAG: glucose 1-dehydrogenase [Rhizobiales bacterium]|nr:glucose 1-dehydrogenase [Hyphomicrobiales bacterium]